jgi:F-type H+-transporting ATPase subunit a
MMSGAEGESVHDAAAAGEAIAHEAATHGGGEFDAGGMIMHHILDSREFEVPLSALTGNPWIIHLPHWQFELFGRTVDISITKNVLMLWIASAIVLTLFTLAARKSHEPVPRGLRGFLEVLIQFVRDEIARKSIGKGADYFVPYLLSTFFFILTCNLLGLIPGMATATSCNLLGLIPGMATATSGISVTAALAVIAFVMIQLAGIRNYGLMGHIKHLVPLEFSWGMLPIILILIPVEILGLLVKPFALCVRLFANMTAGHVVILSLISMIFILKTPFMGLVSVPFALFIYLLEILVAFIQAFVFTLLTALFIGMSAHPAH